MNRIELIGNLTDNPALGQTSNGKIVCKFTIAVNEKYKGEVQSTYVPCTTFEGMAEAINKYAFRGNKIYVAGKLRIDKYTDNEGIKRTAPWVLVSEVEFLPNGSAKTDSEKESVGSDGDVPSKKEKPLMVPVDNENLPF